MKIPFCLTLRNLILFGKDRERAEARWNLSGEELDRKLLSIDFDTNSLRETDEYKVRQLDIDKKYGKIGEMDYDIALNKVMEKDDKKRSLNELKILKDYGKIDSLEYTKRYNDVLGKPWVAIRTNPEITDDDNLEIEVAYNDTFIKQMKAKGLPGDTPEEIAEQWLKLFMIANLDEDDLKMVGSEQDEDKPSVKTTKLDNNKKFIG